MSLTVRPEIYPKELATKAGFNLPQIKQQASQQGLLSDKTTHFGLDCAAVCPRKWYQYAATFTVSDKRVNHSRRAAARGRAIPRQRPWGSANHAWDGDKRTSTMRCALLLTSSLPCDSSGANYGLLQSEENRLLYDDGNGVQYGSFGDAALNGEGDTAEVQRENEALQRVVAKTSK
jgi:hypothetical protein